MTAVIPISDIDAKISHYQHILSSLPWSDPLIVSLILKLGCLYHDRCAESRQKEDLDGSIFYFTQAIFVSRPSWDVLVGDKYIVLAFFCLAFALVQRAEHFNEPSDAQCCVLALKYLRYLQSQPLEALNIPSNQVRALLVVGLASQVKTGIGDLVRHFDEMTDHCRELLASDDSQSHLLRAATALASAKLANHDPSYVLEVSDKVIKCLRDANRRLDSPELAHDFAVCLFARFKETHAIDDYEEAMAIFDKIISSESNKKHPGPYLAHAAYSSALLACGRVRIYMNPEHIEEAVHHCGSFLRISSTDDPRRRSIKVDLAMVMKRRSEWFGVTERPQEAQSSDTDVTDVPSFSDLASSFLAESTAGKAKWWWRTGMTVYLRALKSVYSTTDLAKIEEAINYHLLLLASYPPPAPIDDFIYPSAYLLAGVLLHAFKCTDKLEYLDQSVATLRGLLEMPIPSRCRFPVMENLLSALLDHKPLSNSGTRDDFEEAMQLCSMASKDTHAHARDRLMVSCKWALHARRNGHPSASAAYKAAIISMEDTFLYAPTLQTQHFQLLSLRSYYEELPMDCASYEVDRGQLKDAIQVLERGRALVWSELRGLRASINQLPVKPHLANEFTAVNGELETLTMSIPLDTVMGDKDGHEDREGIDNFGRLVVSHRKLLAKRRELVSQIQAIPGSENFMKARSFDHLLSAAANGPVIIINHCRWRSDMLVVLHNTDPLLITTPEDFYDRAIELRNRLVTTRKGYPLESRQYQRALQSVLKSLYDLVGEPVIKALRRVGIPEQSRIWWCPTSVFCSLPLHAMGPIPSDDGVLRYFSDLYIPSYTPTLSSLIESRKIGKSTLEKPSILLVAHPDDTLRQAWSEIWTIQRLDTKVTTFLGKRARNSAVLEGLRDHQFTHFVCHGNLVPEKPFEAYFRLHKGNRLSLLDIVRSHLPDAEFAFLSACHTAELTEGSIADEGLHLAAAVQYCGFRSVVGTMWAMADQDGSDLAEYFYKSMFSADQAGVPYYERSARALRDAVRTLRKKKNLPLEQWVNFVHYGA